MQRKSSQVYYYYWRGSKKKKSKNKYKYKYKSLRFKLFTERVGQEEGVEDEEQK